jgi:hypothetical protein
MKIVFERDYTEEKYNNLKQCLEAEMIILTKVILNYLFLFINNLLTNKLIL